VVSFLGIFVAIRYTCSGDFFSILKNEISSEFMSDNRARGGAKWKKSAAEPQKGSTYLSILGGKNWVRIGR
jgi:hypothetical protein